MILKLSSEKLCPIESIVQTIGYRQLQAIVFLSDKVDLVHKTIYENGTLAKTKFPFFNELPKRRIGTDDKDLRFFLSTKYDYVKNIWKSGFFKIDENLWDNSGYEGLQFPIEGYGYILVTLS